MRRETFPHRLDGLMDSVLTVRFVISILCGTITLSITAGVLVWQAGRFYETLSESITTQATAIADLKQYVAQRVVSRDLRDDTQDAKITTLEQRVTLLQWRADNLK